MLISFCVAINISMSDPITSEIQLRGQGIIMEAVRRLDEERREGPLDEIF